MTDIQWKKAHTIKTADGGLVMDATYFPLIMVRWIGTPTIELVDGYFEIRRPMTEYGDKIGTKVIVITDISKTGVPTAVIRKYLSDKGIATDVQFPCLNLYITVIPSAVMRGVVTAISWMVGDKGVPTKNTDSMESALNMAKRTFESLNVDAVVPDASYKVRDP